MTTTPPRARAHTLLDVMDLAKRLRCSLRYVWQLRQAGALPDPIDVGGLLRWRPEDIDRWIQACPQLVARRQAKAATTKARKTSGWARTRARLPDPGS
jgi:predicted DNA-binding transcriptional regulator AlpA